MEEEFFVKDCRAFDFFEIDHAVVDVYLPKIGVYAFTVYSVLSRFSQAGESSVTHLRISQIIHCSTASVKRAIADLMAAGLLGVKSGKEEGKPNIYFILAVPVAR